MNDKILSGQGRPGRVNATGPLQVLFLGTRAAFSLPPLRALLAAEITVAGVWLPAPRPLLQGLPAVRALHHAAVSELPLLAQPAEEPTIVELAWEREIPVYQVGRLDDPAVLDLARELAPTFICVACFPAILPPALLAIPAAGSLNVHPSLLPAYRGPVPIFWIFRHGERRTGVTVHLIDPGIDSGAIVAQEGFDLPDGISGSAVDRRCADIGGRLLVESVRGLVAGTLTPRPQDEAAASYFSWPTAADFELPVTRSARWAFNFVRGADEWELSFEIVVGDERIPIRAVRDWSSDGRLPAPYLIQGDEILVQFTPGILRAVLAKERPS